MFKLEVEGCLPFFSPFGSLVRLQLSSLNKYVDINLTRREKKCPSPLLSIGLPGFLT